MHYSQEHSDDSNTKFSVPRQDISLPWTRKLRMYKSTFLANDRSLVRTNHRKYNMENLQRR